MSKYELEAAMQELKELKLMREELDTELVALEDKIKAYMGEAEEVTAGAYKATWKTVTSSRFDSTLFKKEKPELAAMYTKTVTVRRFSVN